MEIFLDDFCVFSKKSDHLDCLEKCFKQCDKFGISLNSDKCHFGVPFGKLLGHIVSAAGIAMDPDKIKIILELPVPETISGVRGFMGHTSYYRRFVYLFAQLCLPLTNLLKKTDEGISPEWTSSCTEAFDGLKQRLVTAQILIAPDWTKLFHV